MPIKLLFYQGSNRDGLVDAWRFYHRLFQQTTALRLCFIFYQGNQMVIFYCQGQYTIKAVVRVATGWDRPLLLAQNVTCQYGQFCELVN